MKKEKQIKKILDILFELYKEEMTCGILDPLLKFEDFLDSSYIASDDDNYNITLENRNCTILFKKTNDMVTVKL